MNWIVKLLLLVILGLSLNCQPSFAQSPTLERSPTLADQQLQRAQTLLRYLPQEGEGYDQLAAAYLLKSRETGDFSYTAKAEQALEQALHRTPDDGVALKLQLVLLLTEHRFQAALDLAQQLQTRFPQDPQVETAMIDALVELGDYPRAIATAQSALELRPGAAVYARISYLRSLQGDAGGAIAALRQAIQAAPTQDREGFAWYHVHLGIELLNAGQQQAGEQALDRALTLFPEYPLALAAKARARLTAQDWEQAISFYRRAEDQMPLPDVAMGLGDLYQAMGDPDSAQRQYDLVDFLVQVGGESFCQAYAHQLALFWADQGKHLEAALALIQQERLTRSDIYTFDALAWCLFKLGRWQEAQTAIAQALRLGTQDARLFYHAGLIYQASHQDAQAAQFLQQALTLNPVFHPLQAAIARQTLGELATAPSTL